MEQDSSIDFELVTHVEGMHFQPGRPEGIEFRPTGDCGLRFVLLPADPDGDACGNCRGLTCRAYATYPATHVSGRFKTSHSWSLQNQPLPEAVVGVLYPGFRRTG